MPTIVSRRQDQIKGWINEIRSLKDPTLALRLVRGVDYTVKTKSLREKLSRYCHPRKIRLKTKTGTNGKQEYIDLWLSK